MNSEQYLTHPTFGLLFLICPAGEESALYSTLYTQQLFFVVTPVPVLSFEPIGREKARRIVESRIKVLRVQGENAELDRMQQFQQRHF
ncbi:PipX family protein [Gloeobacter morelensis]|uniref:PipX family protein n=1 Tax=Gloeobacter morelensis MG652769 TaxID=2781736 RepID=A0ABY3PNZ9_9CYAN|nr:PipX family protein [Gloeobacter morelensis]UFP95411.1 PipX family protein [Gloeobacter morelensis MG652769]